MPVANKGIMVMFERHCFAPHLVCCSPPLKCLDAQGVLGCVVQDLCQVQHLQAGKQGRQARRAPGRQFKLGKQLIYLSVQANVCTASTSAL